MFSLIFFAAIAYAIGSVSAGILISKVLKIADPRTQGSGNIGATNILRYANAHTAAVVLGGDILKGLLPILIARLFGLDYMALGLVGAAAVAGHIFPVFHNFKGGKGVATAMGVLIGLSPLLAIFVGIVWGAMAAIFRYSSLASITAACVAPIASLWFSNLSHFIPIALISALVVWRHYGNIQRLLDKKEPKIGEKS